MTPHGGEQGSGHSPNLPEQGTLELITSTSIESMANSSVVSPWPSPSPHSHRGCSVHIALGESNPWESAPESPASPLFSPTSPRLPS